MYHKYIALAWIISFKFLYFREYSPGFYFKKKFNAWVYHWRKSPIQERVIIQYSQINSSSVYYILMYLYTADGNFPFCMIFFHYDFQHISFHHFWRFGLQSSSLLGCQFHILWNTWTIQPNLTTYNALRKEMKTYIQINFWTKENEIFFHITLA